MFLQRTLEKRKICIKIIDQIDKIHYFLLSCGFENQGCDNKRSASSKESHLLSNEDVLKVLRWHVRYPIYWTSQLNLCAIVSVDRSQLSKFLRPLNFQRLSLCYPCFQTGPLVRSFNLSLGFSHRRHCRSFLGFLLQRSLSVCCALFRGCTNRCF